MSDDRAATILVVDDVPVNVRPLEAVLTSRGYDVVSATDGRAALELAESTKPDLVLLDVMMPQPDGYAVCRRLREREETAVLPVLTASDGAEKTVAIEDGADDFIPAEMRATLAEREREAAARVAVAEERRAYCARVGAVRHKLPQALEEDREAPHRPRRDAPPAWSNAERRRRRRARPPAWARRPLDCTSTASHSRYRARRPR